MVKQGQEKTPAQYPSLKRFHHEKGFTGIICTIYDAIETQGLAVPYGPKVAGLFMKIGGIGFPDFLFVDLSKAGIRGQAPGARKTAF
jgi:hypothetical protein